MAIQANVVDGKLQYDYTDSTAKKNEALGSNLGYDQFLQLLCAEMQYQDPLEPTSNTDYVAQLATFSQLEATLSVKESQQSSMANSLVGQQVILRVENKSTGKTDYVDGKVDYVMYQDGEIYLSVNNALYPISDLDTVADNDYYEAVGLSKTFTNMVAALPDANDITTSFQKMVESVRDTYDKMTDYQKEFVDSKSFTKLQEVITRLNELLKSEGKETIKGLAGTEVTDKTDNTGNTDNKTDGDTTGSTDDKTDGDAADGSADKK